MYVSTAYSNAHLKKHSTVKEQLYPLREQDGQEVDHAAIVDRLLAMPVEEAQSEVHTFRLCCCAHTRHLRESGIDNHLICLNPPAEEAHKQASLGSLIGVMALTSPSQSTSM